MHSCIVWNECSKSLGSEDNAWALSMPEMVLIRLLEFRDSSSCVSEFTNSTMAELVGVSSCSLAITWLGFLHKEIRVLITDNG